MSRHWSEHLWCQNCGKTIRSMTAEARHRHNFPLLCRKVMTKQRKEKASAQQPRICEGLQAGSEDS